LDKTFFEKIGAFEFEGLQVTNFEMETAGIFGLAKILGHRAASCNAILANRLTNEFSKDHLKAENKLIAFVLEKVTG
jgi:uridine phosphorylase